MEPKKTFYILFACEIRYKAEIIAAQKAGFVCLYFSFKKVQQGDFKAAFEHIPDFGTLTPIIMRGYVLPPIAYQALHTYLKETRHLLLINSPQEYLHVGSVVNHYRQIKTLCPKTTWTTDPTDLPTLMENLDQTFTKPTRLMIKDFMRSAKYQRLQSFDISDSSSVLKVKEAIQELITAKQGLLEGGVVFSEFIELKRMHEAPLPLTRQNIYEEYRLWFYGGKLILKTGYFEEMPIYTDKLAEEELIPFLAVAKLIHATFFVMDIARKLDGSLAIIELNPAQTSGINYHHHHQFYQQLIIKLNEAKIN